MIWCLSVLALTACDDEPGTPPMDDQDASVMADAGAADAGPAVPDGGVSLDGCQAGEPCRCPQGEYDGRSYILCPDAVTHAEAAAACASAGMQLITIDTAEEQEWVWTMSDDTFIEGAKDVWIGLNDADEEGTFVWADGSPLGSYTNWVENQPDNGGSDGDAVDEDCVELSQYAGGQWNDQDCSRDYLGFICEG